MDTDRWPGKRGHLNSNFTRRKFGNDSAGYTGTHLDGYGFQIEMTYRAIRAGFRVREIPITFHDRRAGASKMDTRIAAEAVWKVPTLRWRLRGGGAVAG